ncbi:hypothetical protein ACFL6M_06260 [Candidatus Eisenbacteria bacterium]|uniref:Uncharacterized protein n=1 Tax=Eiseniibacteriota bacterium TaxID=2212470 RepID=A0ABV6YLH6_UNCEI
MRVSFVLLLLTATFGVCFPFPLSTASATIPADVRKPQLGTSDPDLPEVMVLVEGGETIGDAVPITDWFTAYSGSTCGHADDHDEVCPYSGSIAPDVVYTFTAPGAGGLQIDLCASQYDTKAYLYDFAAGYGFGNPVACNDDGGCGITGYQSLIDAAPIGIGHTYHLVIDGYGDDCGDYVLNFSWL